MRKLIPLLLLAAVLLAGCNKTDSVTYTGIEAGTLGSGVFVSDNGVRMYVVGNESNFDVSQTRRVVVKYETRPTTDPDHIEIDLLGLMQAIIREPFPIETLDDEPSGSPIVVNDAWFSGGYLNLLVAADGKDYNKHLCSANYTAGEDGIVIRLRHDNYEENASNSNSGLTAFLSLPMYEPQVSYEHYALSIGLKQPFPVAVTLQWTSTTLDGGPLALYERKGSYSPPTAD